ncbi:MAG: radical SAM protein [Spirochaetales bacterium]|nr:radical SAM protein [Spirochaetales bacterium]MCF7936967.1 radical SAM protein [Spirochaetales bacterium]
MSKAVRLIKFLRGVAQKSDYPKAVNFDITSECNLDCEHCYWRKTYDPGAELSDEQWEAVFSDYSSKGIKSAFLTGGEPSLRLPVIRAAYKYFDGITIVSNGTLPIPEDIQARIFISIDGPRAVHDKIRGRHVFDTVMKNIQGDKRVILTPTLSTNNYKYIDELAEITREADVDGITFSTYTSHMQSGDPLLLEGEELEWTANKLREVWKNNKDIVLLSPYIIKLLQTKKHHTKCYMRNRKKIVSYDAQMQQKEPCVLGKGVNCATCGCIVPVVAHALTRGDIRAWLVFDKLYSERYYS